VSGDLLSVMACVHRWGWHLTLNPDGTTTSTATHPRTKRTLHSHAQPTAA
jgi:hypothetical protein